MIYVHVIRLQYKALYVAPVAGVTLPDLKSKLISCAVLAQFSVF
jgi:hypothetical protein